MAMIGREGIKGFQDAALKRSVGERRRRGIFVETIVLPENWTVI